VGAFVKKTEVKNQVRVYLYPPLFCRIEKFSFGDAVAGIIQPLEGDEKISDISKFT
jgi:hypothetical protein